MCTSDVRANFHITISQPFNHDTILYHDMHCGLKLQFVIQGQHYMLHVEH